MTAMRMPIGILSLVVALALVCCNLDPVPFEVMSLDAYSEGPVFDYEGNLFVSHGREFVSKLAVDGEVSLWGRFDHPNGHKVRPDGTHLLCVKGAVLHLAADGRTLAEAATLCAGVPLRSPNDLTLDGKGGFYFTDPGGSWDEPIGTIHYVDAVGETSLVAGHLSVPNGLALSPDHSTLYVAETKPNRILAFEVISAGRLGPRRVFADLPGGAGIDGPDGMAVDARGNVYVAQLGSTSILALDTAGRLVRTLPAGNYDASNLVFGGDKLDNLYVTGSLGRRFQSPGRVFRLHLTSVAGVSSLLPATTARH